MPEERDLCGKRAQIALEFMIVYSFVLVIFVLLFALISTQRAANLAQQQFFALQLEAQNVAGLIDQAISSGNGFSASAQIQGALGTLPNNLSISTTGVIIAKAKSGTQILAAYAFSGARNLVINGTLLTSGSGINVYLVPTTSGTIKVANSKGAIYVDQSPISTQSLPATLTPVIYQHLRTANFNGVTSNVFVGNVPIPSSAGVFSESAWVNFNSLPSSGSVEIAGEGASTCSSSSTYCLSDSATSNILFGSSACGSISSGTSFAPLTNVWYDVVATYNSIGGNYIYINGNQVASGKVGLCNNAVKFQMGSDSTSDYLSGGLANVQLYNAVLSSANALQIFQSGIGGTPVLPSANVVGWWPLNGTTGDYSSNFNSGTANSIGYNSVVYLKEHATLANGANAISMLVGVIGSNGIFNQSTANSVALYTDSNGIVQTYLTALSMPMLNLTVEGFGGNLTTEGNLIGWWPLTLGYNAVGNVIYDLSTKYDNGAFTNPAWTPYANATNLQTGGFNGASSVVNVVNTVSLDIPSNRLTISAWVNWTGGGTNNYIADKYSNKYGLELLSATSYKPRFVIVGHALDGAASLSANVMHNIVGTWDGTNQLLYVDGKLSSNTVDAGAVLAAGGNLMLGCYQSCTSSYSFSGNIVNVQLYNITLSAAQVSQLYQQGAAGTPTMLANVVGWWSLDGSANDYSSNNNNGVPANVVYNNVQYTNGFANSPLRAASFNGAGSYISTNVPSVNSAAGGYNTATFWMYSNSSASNVIFAPGGVINSAGKYSFEFASGCLGFNTHSADVYGVSGAKSLLNRWLFVAAVFYNGGYTGNSLIYINGAKQTLSQCAGSASSGTANALVNIGTGIASPGYYYSGLLADVQLYNSILTSTQISQLYQQQLPFYQRFNATFG